MLDNPFWRYSLALYANTQPWCLQLQDQRNASVNLLLFCCYIGSKGQLLSPQQLSELQQLIDGWDRCVVKPLRSIRRQLAATVLGTDISAARQILLAAELEAEQQIQQRLYGWWQQQSLPEQQPSPQEVAKVITCNLKSYYQQLRITEPLPGDLIDLAISAAE